MRSSAYWVRAAVWVTLLARQIGLVTSDINASFLAYFLAVVGRDSLCQRLMVKRGDFRKKAFAAYKKHVRLGVNLGVRLGMNLGMNLGVKLGGKFLARSPKTD